MNENKKDVNEESLKIKAKLDEIFAQVGEEYQYMILDFAKTALEWQNADTHEKKMEAALKINKLSSMNPNSFPRKEEY